MQRMVTDTAAVHTPRAVIARGASPVHLDQPDGMRGKRVLVVEDGPTVSHGDMSFGAGAVAATQAQAAAINAARVDDLACCFIATEFRRRLGTLAPPVASQR
jgi:predicted GTPase